MPRRCCSVRRSRAFREQGFHDAAHEALKEALRSRSRGVQIRHMALAERAQNYLAQSKKGMARKDLERILAEDSDYEGVREQLAELTAWVFRGEAQLWRARAASEELPRSWQHTQGAPAAKFSQPTPSLSPSNSCGSGSATSCLTVKLRYGICGQSRSGGGGRIQTVATPFFYPARST